MIKYGGNDTCGKTYKGPWNLKKGIHTVHVPKFLHYLVNIIGVQYYNMLIISESNTIHCSVGKSSSSL